ncbi:MAG: hypothetical protein WA484_01960 [Solirubrobacteraceae bacterium]
MDFEMRRKLGLRDPRLAILSERETQDPCTVGRSRIQARRRAEAI